MSTPERFIDGIGNLAVQGAVARIELTVLLAQVWIQREHSENV